MTEGKRTLLSPNTTVQAQRCVAGAGAGAGEGAGSGAGAPGSGCTVDFAAKGLDRLGAARVELRFAGGGMVGEAVAKQLNIEMRMAKLKRMSRVFIFVDMMMAQGIKIDGNSEDKEVV